MAKAIQMTLKMQQCCKPKPFGPSRVVHKLTNQRARDSRSSLQIVRLKNASFLEDRILSIKFSLAKSSGKLDLGWLGLEEIPPEVFDITSLEVIDTHVPNLSTTQYPSC